MAKDGTLRGGARTGAGKKRKAAADKLKEGKPAQVIRIAGMQDDDADCEETKTLQEYMCAKQQDGRPLEARNIYDETLSWLRKMGCEQLVNPQLVEHYAMSMARWKQCEECITEGGLLGGLDRNGNPAAHPLIAASQNYMKQTNVSWNQIYSVVKANCTYDVSAEEDPMEALLRMNM